MFFQRIHLIKLALILISASGGAVYAQPQVAKQLSFRHFDVEDGLSQGSINAILQDHKGFMWIGTHDGLNRFDETEFRVFRHHPEDSTSLSSSWIISIVEDQSQVLWVKTEKGLDRFDHATQSFARVPDAPNFIGGPSRSDTATVDNVEADRIDGDRHAHA